MKGEIEKKVSHGKISLVKFSVELLCYLSSIFVEHELFEPIRLLSKPNLLLHSTLSLLLADLEVPFELLDDHDLFIKLSNFSLKSLLCCNLHLVK